MAAPRRAALALLLPLLSLLLLRRLIFAQQPAFTSIAELLATACPRLGNGDVESPSLCALGDGNWTIPSHSPATLLSGRSTTISGRPTVPQRSGAWDLTAYGARLSLPASLTAPLLLVPANATLTLSNLQISGALLRTPRPFEPPAPLAVSIGAGARLRLVNVLITSPSCRDVAFHQVFACNRTLPSPDVNVDYGTVTFLSYTSPSMELINTTIICAPLPPLPAPCVSVVAATRDDVLAAVAAPLQWQPPQSISAGVPVAVFLARNISLLPPPTSTSCPPPTPAFSPTNPRPPPPLSVPPLPPSPAPPPLQPSPIYFPQDVLYIAGAPGGSTALDLTGSGSLIRLANNARVVMRDVALTGLPPGPADAYPLGLLRAPVWTFAFPRAALGGAARTRLALRNVRLALTPVEVEALARDATAPLAPAPPPPPLPPWRQPPAGAPWTPSCAYQLGFFGGPPRDAVLVAAAAAPPPPPTLPPPLSSSGSWNATATVTAPPVVGYGPSVLLRKALSAYGSIITFDAVLLEPSDVSGEPGSLDWRREPLCQLLPLQPADEPPRLTAAVVSDVVKVWAGLLPANGIGRSYSGRLCFVLARDTLLMTGPSLPPPQGTLTFSRLQSYIDGPTVLLGDPVRQRLLDARRVAAGFNLRLPAASLTLRSLVLTGLAAAALHPSSTASTIGVDAAAAAAALMPVEATAPAEAATVWRRRRRGRRQLSLPEPAAPPSPLHQPFPPPAPLFPFPSPYFPAGTDPTDGLPPGMANFTSCLWLLDFDRPGDSGGTAGAAANGGGIDVDGTRGFLDSVVLIVPERELILFSRILAANDTAAVTDPDVAAQLRAMLDRSVLAPTTAGGGVGDSGGAGGVSGGGGGGDSVLTFEWLHWCGLQGRNVTLAAAWPLYDSTGGSGVTLLTSALDVALPVQYAHFDTPPPPPPPAASAAPPPGTWIGTAKPPLITTTADADGRKADRVDSAALTTSPADTGRSLSSSASGSSSSGDGSSKSSNNSSSSSTGSSGSDGRTDPRVFIVAIVCGVVAGLLLALLVCVAVVWCVRRRRGNDGKGATAAGVVSFTALGRTDPAAAPPPCGTVGVPCGDPSGFPMELSFVDGATAVAAAVSGNQLIPTPPPLDPSYAVGRFGPLVPAQLDQPAATATVKAAAAAAASGTVTSDDSRPQPATGAAGQAAGADDSGYGADAEAAHSAALGSAALGPQTPDASPSLSPWALSAPAADAAATPAPSSSAAATATAAEPVSSDAAYTSESAAGSGALAAAAAVVAAVNQQQQQLLERQVALSLHTRFIRMREAVDPSAPPVPVPADAAPMPAPAAAAGPSPPPSAAAGAAEGGDGAAAGGVGAAAEAGMLTVTGELGRGAQGVVYRGRWRGIEVAVKSLLLHRMAPAPALTATTPLSPLSTTTLEAATPPELAQQRALREAAISVAASQHPNVVATYHVEVAALGPGGGGTDGAGRKGMEKATGTATATGMGMGGASCWKITLFSQLCDGGSLRAALQSGLLARRSTSGQRSAATAAATTTTTATTAPSSGHDSRSDAAIEPQQPQPLLQPRVLLLLALDVASGLAQLHSTNIVHGDVSSGNVLLMSLAGSQAAAGNSGSGSGVSGGFFSDTTATDSNTGRINTSDRIPNTSDGGFSNSSDALALLAELPYERVRRARYLGGGRGGGGDASLLCSDAAAAAAAAAAMGRYGYVAKLCDFGLAEVLPPGKSYIDTPCRRSSAYTAPELALEGRVGPPADVYSWGILAWEMALGRPLPVLLASPSGAAVRAWLAGSSYTSVAAAAEAEVGLPPALLTWPDQVPRALVVLVGECLRSDPAARPTARDVVQRLEHIITSL